jgi:tight adherence protein C
LIVLRLRILAAATALLVVVTPFTTVHAQSAPLEVTEVRTDGFPRVVVRLRESPDASAALQAGQLAVLENGQPQPSADVLQLRNPTVPTAVALAIDVSGSMADQNKLTQAQSSAKAFTEQIRPIDKVAVVSFADVVDVPQSLTADRKLLARSIDLLSAGGNTSLYDAVAQGLTQLSLSPSNARALVVLTDGIDNMSERQISDDIAQAVAMTVPIYAIGLGSDADTRVLQQFAATTGGSYYSAPTAQDLTNVFRLISRQLGAEYQVSWVSNSPVTAADTNVSVQINLARTDGTQTSADLTYLPPAFAVQARPANPIQALAEISPTTAPPEWLAQLAGALAGVAVATLVFGYVRRHVDRRLQTRLSSFVSGLSTTLEDESHIAFSRRQLSPLTAATATYTARVLPRKQVAWLRRKLIQAGYPSDRQLAMFLASEVALAAVIGSAAFAAMHLTNFATRSPVAVMLLAGVAAVFGAYLPYMWLRRRVESRQRSLMRALPDALDLMVISVTAGLSLDTAMAEVVQKWPGDLSRELNQVLNEMRMGISRRDALRNFADRTQIQDIQLLVAALLQADELGSNISEALSAQADQLRVRRHHHAEEMARKAPIKMLMPLVLLIFPAMFVVVLAPAFLQITRVLGAFAGHH